MLRHFPRRAAAVVLALLFVTTGLARAADWPVARGPSHEPNPYQFDAGQVKKLPRDFLEDFPAVYLYSGTTQLVEADGTVETIGHEIIRLNGRKGIEGLGEYRAISYEPNYQKLTLNEARVHKLDGRIVPLDPRHVRLRDTNTDYAVYDHDKQLILSFADLEVGDCIEARWTIRGRNPEYQGQFFYRHTFGNDACPVAREELRVRLPETKTFVFAPLGGEIEPHVQNQGGMRTYTWQVENRKPLPRDENLPPLEEMRLQLLCSTFTSWKGVEDWNRQLATECWKCTPEIHKIVEAVTNGLKTEEEKARTLTHWVRRNVRYISASTAGERHDFTPDTPIQVLTQRYGDCKDSSQLLAVMLHDAGIQVGLVTLNTAEAGQIVEAVPSPAGNHAILLVTIGGKQHWIDTTVRLSGWDFLPPDDRDRVCYVVDDQGLRVLRTPPMTADDNRFAQTTVVYLRPSGNCRCERTANYFGLAAWGQRESWVETPAGERRRLVVAELQNALDQPKLQKLTIDEARLANYDQPVKATLEYESTTFEGANGTFRDLVIWPRLLALNVDPERETPLLVGRPFDSAHRFILHLPTGYRLGAPPENLEVKSPWGKFKLEFKKFEDDPWRVEVTFHTRLNKVRVEPAELEAFRKFQKDVDEKCLVTFIALPTEELSDAPALEKVLEKKPDNNAAVRVLAQLYLKHTKWEEARRVLQKGLQAIPEDDELSQLMLKVAETMKTQAAVDRGKAHFQLAENAAQRGEYALALENFEKAGEADPACVKSASACEFKGSILDKLDRKKDALAAYRQMLAQRPDDATALAALIGLSLDTGDRATALDYLRRFTLKAEDAERQAAAADFHLRLGRQEDALDLAERASKSGPHALADQVLGLLALHRGDAATAIKHLQAALKEDKQEKRTPSVRLLAGLVSAYLLQGELKETRPLASQLKAHAETEEAKPVLAQLDRLTQRRAVVVKLQATPTANKAAWDRALDHFVCAERLHSEGKPATRVETVLSASFSEGIEFGPAFGLRSVLLLERGRLTEALADAEKAVGLSPTNPRGHYVRGRIRLERGNEGALADLQKAAELSACKEGEVLHWLATAQHRAGQLDEAIKTQRQAAECCPTNSEYVEQLKRFEEASAAR